MLGMVVPKGRCLRRRRMTQVSGFDCFGMMCKRESFLEKNDMTHLTQIHRLMYIQLLWCSLGTPLPLVEEKGGIQEEHT